MNLLNKKLILIFSIFILSIFYGFRLLNQRDHESIENILKQMFSIESVWSNAWSVSKNISMLEQNRLISCVKLEEKGSNNISKVFYDSTSKPDCQFFKLFNIFGFEHSLSIDSINGIRFSIKYYQKENYIRFTFELLTYLFVIFVYLLIFYINKNEELNLQIVINNEKNKNLFLQEYNLIANQLAHDIRGPVSLLNILISKYSFEEKQILTNVTERINQIANDLLLRAKTFDDNLNKEELSRKNPASFLNENASHPYPTEEPIVAKIKSGAEEFESVELCKVVELLVQEKLMTSKNSKCNITFQNNSKVSVKCSKVQLERIISNLINNSMESRDKEDITIDISVREYADFVSLTLFDNGKGIPEEVLSRIGERGFSFGKENILGAGNGLGVFGAKSYIESIGGRFSISSKLGVGTMIEICFPNSN